MKKHGRRQAAVKIALLIGVLLTGAWNIFIGHRSVTQSRSRQASAPALHTSHRVKGEGCFDSASIYHIGIADIEGGVGTALYQLVINQLWYADTHKLTPWVHLLPNVSKVIDDPVFFSDHGKPIRLQVRSKAKPEALRGGPHRRHIVPGRPVLQLPSSNSTLTIPGDGIWNHYFHPVSKFDPSCSTNTNYVTTSLENIHLVIPGLHGYAGIRCWRYDYLPSYITRPHQSWTRWIADSRQRAAPLVAKYIRPRVEVQPPPTKICLGLHIRHSDKAAGRRVITTHEFLPFAQAFVDHTEAADASIYVATDSALVLDEIHAMWPAAVAQRVHVAPHMVRSNTTTAVFDSDGANHHRTNTEAIQEILALSQCQFLVHGHSAVSEAAIWTNPELHETAVNLEDDDHLNAVSFGSLVRMKLEGVVPSDQWPKAIHEEEAWIDDTTRTTKIDVREPTQAACKGYDGILWIRAVREEDSTVAGFFRSVLSQIQFAHDNSWKPWIHLTDAPLMFDALVHGENRVAEMSTLDASSLENRAEIVGNAPRRELNVTGNGIWNQYFEPVSDYLPRDKSCDETPLLALNPDQVSELVSSTNSNDLIALVQGVRFRPYVLERAQQVHSAAALDNSVCLGVHIRLAGKKERRTAAEYYLHIEAYVRAGGTCIYLATDTYKAVKYIHNNFPESITAIIRTQGDHIVRSDGGEWPTHMLDDHHRVNAETLVDVLALSKCNLLLHTNSTLSQVALAMNSDLHGVDISDRDIRMSPLQFEKLSRFVLGVDAELQTVPNEEQATVRLPFIQPRVVVSYDSQRACRSKAIVYLAQKVHSSYGRDSYSNLLRSLDLLNRNYLSTDHQHLETVDIFIFHTGDFNASDLAILQGQLGKNRGVVRLIDLSKTKYWARPEHQLKDRPEDWYAWPLFSEGYRRMMHWFAVDIWDFFAYYNQEYGCSYRYILRLDEDSFIHSPINYDIFNFMNDGDYVYGFRMCAYEMQVTQRMSKLWMKRHEGFLPQRSLDLELCGFYNNFFVADLEFFQRSDVSNFLRFIDRQGHIYRRRLGDLMIHSMAVYWFAPQTRIHRFLDFTYEHGTFNKADGCLLWGGIQAGYLDEKASEVLKFYENMRSKGCPVNTTMMTGPDLSPTYAHFGQELSLRTVSAGKVEISGKGTLSG